MSSPLPLPFLLPPPSPSFLLLLLLPPSSSSSSSSPPPPPLPPPPPSCSSSSSSTLRTFSLHSLFLSAVVAVVVFLIFWEVGQGDWIMWWLSYAIIINLVISHILLAYSQLLSKYIGNNSHSTPSFLNSLVGGAGSLTNGHLGEGYSS